MFDGLSDRLSAVLDKLTRRGSLTEEDVGEAMREVRRALLEADVALEVVRSFTDKVRARAVGAEVVRSVTPGQMVVKIVHDALVETLGTEAEPIALDAAPPVAILMVGLQGSGKTTTTAKIAKRLTERGGKRVLMASLDTRRPAAMEQLATLGAGLGIATLPIVAGQDAPRIAARAKEAARLGGYDVVMLDTAGRTTVDEGLMDEVARVKAAAAPREVLLVADALTGQDAVTTARAFEARVGITGIVLTRVDGDGRGGAALSMRAVTGRPIKLLGVGERPEDLEDFHPRRIADRILGMGDIVSLVERAAGSIDEAKAKELAGKLAKGKFDLADLRDQLRQMERIGGLQGVLGMLPGVGKMKDQLAGAGLDDRVIKRQVAIIDSMTAAERRDPDILKASRKRRIASGSGTKPEDVNKLLKMHRQMADMMKAMSKGGPRGAMAKMAGAFGLGGGAPGLGGGQPSPEALAQLQRGLGGGAPKLGGPNPFGGANPFGAPGKSGLPGLPGLGSGLGGLPGFGKKK